MNTSDLLNTNKIIRYAVVLAGIFVLLKLTPSTSITTKDSLVTTLVLFSLYVVIENVFSKKSFCGSENFNNTNTTLPLPVVNVQPVMPPVQPVQPVQPVTQLVQPVTINTPVVKTHSDAAHPGECKDCVKKVINSDGMESYVYKTHAQKYESGPTRQDTGVMQSELQYTDYNILPVTREDSKLYEYGYSYLPPEKWFPVPPHPPICVTEKKCPVCPVTTTGTPVDMKEWNDSRRITPGDVINIDYAKDKLNSGR